MILEMIMLEEKTMTINKTFQLLDNNKNIIPKVKIELLNLTTKITINKKLIGTIEQDIFENLFNIGSYYIIKDNNNNIIAKSKKFNFPTTNIIISNKYGNISLKQNILTINDQWEINCNNNVDKRLIAFIPAFINSTQKEN